MPGPASTKEKTEYHVSPHLTLIIIIPTITHRLQTVPAAPTIKATRMNTKAKTPRQMNQARGAVSTFKTWSPIVRDGVIILLLLFSCQTQISGYHPVILWNFLIFTKKLETGFAVSSFFVDRASSLPFLSFVPRTKNYCLNCLEHPSSTTLPQEVFLSNTIKIKCMYQFQYNMQSMLLWWLTYCLHQVSCPFIGSQWSRRSIQQLPSKKGKKHINQV